MNLTINASAPAITNRPLSSEVDWWRVRHLLIATHSISGPGFNWELRHWEGNRFHTAGPLWQPERFASHQLWETDEGQLVGVLIPEEKGWVDLQIHPVARQQIEEEMIAYAEEHWAKETDDGKRELTFTVYEYDAPRLRILQRRGYEKQAYGWINRRMHFANQPIPTPVVAEGYTMRSTDPAESGDLAGDCQKIADLLNAAFNRPGFHQGEDVMAFVTRTPMFRHSLNLVMEAPDGSIAAHVGVNYDEINRFGIFEPVCTHPNHLRRGLAKALMLEGMHRLKALGATEVEVSTGDADAANALYDSIGMTEHYKAYCWKKVF